MQIELSIIIVTWNGEGVIRKCLDSILSRSYGFGLEAIVVDNNSGDETLKIIQEEYKGVRLKKNSKNLGFAAANNLGIGMARGRYVLFLNQDVELGKGALKGMLSYLKKDFEGKTAAVAPKLVYPDGRLQLSLRPFPTPGNVLVDLLTLGRWHEKFYDYSLSQAVDQPMAACLMVRKEVLDLIGGFDASPELFLYFNDTDLSFRINKAGYQHFFLPRYKAIHHHGQSARRWLETRRLKAWCDGLYYFLSKHYAKEQVWVRILLRLEVWLLFGGRWMAQLIKKDRN